MSKTVVFLLIVSGISSMVAAAPVIDVGTHYLQPDQAGQTIQIYVTGTDSVQGLELTARIGGGVSGPIFEDVDILTGTIFESNNTGVNPGSYINPRDIYLGTTTSGGSVLTSGLLVTFTIDTTGIYAGQYDLSLIDTLEGKTNFAGVDAGITDGFIVVPEPMSMLILLAGAGMVVRRRKSCR